MCGRYFLEQVGMLPDRFLFPIEELDEHRTLQPRYNVAPAQQIPVVVGRDDGRHLRWMRWGYRPSWFKATSKQPPPINARAETLLERPMFRGAVGKARCIVPADGFYEWQAPPGSRSKQPFCIRLHDHTLIGFAGLYAWAQDEATGEETHSCAIITTAANALMAPIHDRMPVILDPAVEALWLDPSMTEVGAILGCLEPYPAAAMEAYPVAGLVSSVRDDAPELVAPVASA